LINKNSKMSQLKNCIIFDKICNYFNPLGLYEGLLRYLQEKPSTPPPPREHPALQNMKFLHFSTIFMGPDPDPDPKTQLNLDPIRSGSTGT
jgi:hypothetical protein